MPQFIVKNQVRVRNAPRIDSRTFTGFILNPGQLVVGRAVNGWVEYNVTLDGGARFAGYTLLRDSATVYLEEKVASPNPIKPPAVDSPAAGRPAWLSSNFAAVNLGISCLDDHRVGNDALNRGCRAVLFMNGLMEAISAAKRFPDATIIARSWFQNAPDPVWYADHMGRGLADAPQNLYRTCANEADWFGYGSAQDIWRRFEYEKRYAQAMWERSPNAMVVIGEFSHGTPDTTKPEIVKALWESYGQFAAQNPGKIRIGWHLYTKGHRFPHHPATDRTIIDPVWFEGRDMDFYRQWGNPAGVRYVCGETGVEAGGGSFRGGSAHGEYSDDQFAEWCAWWLGYRKSLGDTHDGMVMFQAGSHPGWRGYDVSRYMGILEDFWKGRRQPLFVSNNRSLTTSLDFSLFTAPPAVDGNQKSKLFAAGLPEAAAEYPRYQE
jgi:hypothetical protein